MKRFSNNKGFTLVEIIVVLVVLAVLAAFTIPTMLGFVEDAKGKALIAEAREIYVAAQATATEYIATDPDMTDKKLGSSTDQSADGLLSSQRVTKEKNLEPASQTMKNYLGDDIALDDNKDGWTVVMDTNNNKHSTSTGKVATVTYKKDGYKVTLTAGGDATVEED
ncbi:MAG: type pilus assembly protein PilA [Acetobacterium sp.]|nr:type pilus assembly protein PilA [Acetobacterium sp.]